MTVLRLYALPIMFAASACGGNVQQTRNAPEEIGVGGSKPYDGAEPTQMPPDLRPEGQAPAPNGHPMTSPTEAGASR